jgi:rod shape-determining protein MreD
MNGERSGLKVGVVLFALVVMHFTVRPLLGSDRIAPDFLLLALMFFAIRSRPSKAAVAGFTVGILADALSPVAFGAGALAHTVVGYLQAWGKAVFFPDNLLVTTGFLLAGAWVRNFLVLLAGGQMRGAELFWALTVWSVGQAVTTTIAGLLVLLVFRRWFKIGILQ